MAAEMLLEAKITARTCCDKATLHDYMKDALDFPDHYGDNLSALADCLAESSRPMLITIAVQADEIPAGMQTYIMRLVQVCAREALVNENVSLIIEHLATDSR